MDILVIGLVIVMLYLLLFYLLYPVAATKPKADTRDAHQEERTPQAVDDIMGKSTFDVNAELRRIRLQKEEEARKAAIAKGEMTENGEEIAQEVKPEDCAVEKKVYTQVPTEDLGDMFAEPDVPMAKGDPLDDLDLAFKVARKQNATKEEELKAVEVFSYLSGTDFLDSVEKEFADVGVRINAMLDKYTKKAETEARTAPLSFEDFRPSDYL